MIPEYRELLTLLEQRDGLNEAIATLEFELYQCGKKAVKDYREVWYKPFNRLRRVLEPAGFSIVDLYKLDPCGISCGYYMLHVARKQSRLYHKEVYCDRNDL